VFVFVKRTNYVHTALYHMHYSSQPPAEFTYASGDLCLGMRTCVALPDSGSSFIGVPKAAFEAIVRPVGW
jgi:hypothetical protein